MMQKVTQNMIWLKCICHKYHLAKKYMSKHVIHLTAICHRMLCISTRALSKVPGLLKRSILLHPPPPNILGPSVLKFMETVFEKMHGSGKIMNG